jgi:hypothetical protein
MAKGHKMQITERALIQRINRRLKPDQEKLCTSRTEQARLDVGYYYVVNYSFNGIVQKDVDIEELARKLGVLKAYEEVAGQ